MKVVKKLAALLLSAALLTGMCATSVLAAETDAPTEEPKPAVSVDMEKSGFVAEGGYFDVYLTINDTATANVQAAISDAILAVMDVYAMENGRPIYPVLPGDSNLVHVTINNQSEHTYTYTDGSFYLSSPYAAEEELSPFIGFDGKEIPYAYIAAIPSSHKAIYKNLFGLPSSGDVTADMMFGIYDKLAEKGYTGENAMTAYFLDYYNREYSTEYASWDELAAAKPNLGDTFAQTGSNSIFTMSFGQMKAYCEEHPELAPYVYYETGDMGSVGIGDDDEVRVQIKWPEQDLAAFSYNIFYQDYFSVAYGDDECEQMNPNTNTAFTRTRGVGDYMDPASELYQQTDAYFAGLENADVFAPGETLTFTTMLAIDGPGVGNGYMNYVFSYYNEIAFNQIDTSWTVVHKYYTSIDGGEYTLDGTVTDKAVPGLVGDTVKSADLEKLLQYNGNPYTFYQASGDIQLVLDPAENQIVMEYRRDIKGTEPEDPDDSSSSETPEKPDTTPSEKPDNSQTGDNLMPILIGVAVLLVSGLVCVVFIRKRSRS